MGKKCCELLLLFLFFSLLFSFTDLGSRTEGKREGEEGKKRRKNKPRKNYGAVPVLEPYLHAFLDGLWRGTV